MLSKSLHIFSNFRMNFGTCDNVVKQTGRIMPALSSGLLQHRKWSRVEEGEEEGGSVLAAALFTPWGFLPQFLFAVHSFTVMTVVL